MGSSKGIFSIVFGVDVEDEHYKQDKEVYWRHATVEVLHIFSAAPQVTSSLPHPKTFFWWNVSLLPDENSHGPGIQ